MSGKLLDSRGQEIKKVNIPVIHWKDFILPVRLVPPSVRTKEKISGQELLRELRLGYIEMQDRFTLLAVGLSLVAKENPGGEVDKFLSQCGLQLTDFNGKVIYEANAQKPAENTEN